MESLCDEQDAESVEVDDLVLVLIMTSPYLEYGITNIIASGMSIASGLL